MNYNKDTWIPFGIISANRLHSDLIDDMMFNDNIENFYSDYIGCHDEFLEYCTDDECMCEIDEGFFRGKIDDVSYESCWLGGALNIVILDSPHVTVYAGKASPCVPGMAILDEEGEEYGYTVPPDWLNNEVY